MRRLVWWWLLAGCTDAPDAPQLVDPELTVDVVVSHREVLVYFSRVGQVVDENWLWPQPGQCLAHDDVVSISSEDACISSIAVDRLEAPFLGFPPAYLRVDVKDDSRLTLRTCAGRETTIPIHAGTFPSTTVTVTALGEDSHEVSWSAVADASSIIVESSTGLHGEICHVTSTVTRQGFDFPVTSIGGSYVQPLLSVELVESPLGSVRVWHGDRSFPPLVGPGEAISKTSSSGSL